MKPLDYKQMFRVWKPEGSQKPLEIGDNLRVRKGKVLAPSTIVGWNGISLYCDVQELLDAFYGKGKALPADAYIFVASTAKLLDVAGIQLLQDPDKQILGNTVEQEVAFGMENLGVQRPRMLQRIAEVLSEMHLERFQHQATHTLSGGQRQQVAACGLLVMEPGIFLFDEPFANLDSRAVEELENLIERLRGQGRTVVIVEHRVEEALHLNPNKVLLMREGRQVFFGDTAAFLEVADPTQVKLPIAATLRTLDPQTTVGDLLVRPIITGAARLTRKSSRCSPLKMWNIATNRPLKPLCTAFPSRSDAQKPSPSSAPTELARPPWSSKRSACCDPAAALCACMAKIPAH